MMKKLIPDHIRKARLYPPGKPLDEIKRELGITNVVKLNANENNAGPSPLAVQAIRDAASQVHRYPDNSAYYLRQKLADKYRLAPGNIMLGNGSNELVQFILMTFLLDGESVLTACPTFVLYAIMGRVLGGEVIEVGLKDMRYDLMTMADRITPQTKIVFISNPNNPTGTIVHADEFNRFMESIPRDMLVVVDEAYAEFVSDERFPDSLSYVRQGRPVVVLRTFSKAYGLAGLRLGYAMASAELITHMEKLREPFNANMPAQHAAMASLDDIAHLDKTCRMNVQGRQLFYRELTRLGLAYVETQTNFVLIRIGSCARDLSRTLMHQGIMVRFLEDCGLDDYIRVTIGLPDENEQLIKALDLNMEK